MDKRKHIFLVLDMGSFSMFDDVPPVELFKLDTAATISRPFAQLLQRQQRVLNVADRVFGAIFRQSFSFSLLYEDSEVDNQVLNLDANSHVLAVSGAGCGIAGLLASEPNRIDAVDSNHHHLALTAVKVCAAQKLSSYEEFYQLLGHGQHHAPQQCLEHILTEQPEWIRTYWKKRYKLFQENLYCEGLAGKFQLWLRQKTGLNEDALKAIQSLPPEERPAELERIIVPKLQRSRLFQLLSNSPVFLVGHGINFRQMQLNLNANNTGSMVGVVTNRLKRIAETNLETNWFAWIGATGHFNHDIPEAVPPYLRAENHARSLKNRTKVNFHNSSLQKVLENPPENGWSHFSLCDIMDWMPASAQSALLRNIAQKGRQGAIVLTRTVEDVCLVERLGLQKLYTPLEALSSEATHRDRSGLYGRVSVYRLAKEAAGFGN